MNEVLFVQEREPDWKRLNWLCEKADASPVNLSQSELLELVRLYRRVTKDLSRCRTQSTNAQLIEFLNGLCARAYSQLYRPIPKSFAEGLASAATLAARTVRKRAAFVAASALLLVGFAALAYLCLRYAPETREVLIPPEIEELFGEWRSGDMEPRDALDSMSATAMYGGHNPLVALIEASLGVASFGIGTVYSLFQNGSILGALMHELEPVGRIGYLFVHILPHGVTELSGAVIAGSAGLLMGWALVHPGRRSRSEALKESGKDAIVLLGAAFTLMLVAAPIEGFFSFNPEVPYEAKVALAALSAVAWGFFWFGYGREGESPGLPSSRSRLSRRYT